MRRILTTARIAAAVALAIATAGCRDDDGDGSAAASGARPQIVVTTNILGDVVRQSVGDAADVEVLMPVGADPHDFAPSARQAESMADADLLVLNGAGFEEGLGGVIDHATAAGTPTLAIADHVDLLQTEEGDVDPHVFTDPSRMQSAVDVLAERVAELDGVDPTAVRASARAYAAELEALDERVEHELAAIPPAERVLITNHDVLGYFADRYGFEVIGAVIPSATPSAAPSAADVTALAALIRTTGTKAIFGETTQSTRLVDALADEVGGSVEVVELHTESLGEPGSGADTYVGMIESNAGLIRDALT